MSGRLEGRTVVMSGGSRGIGLAILVEAARHGANVAFLAKTDTPDPRLPGTVHTAVAEIEAVGGKAIGVVGDLRDPEAVDRLVSSAERHFGGIDICINNASALNLAATSELSVSRFDLMQQINYRGTFLLTRACLPLLAKSTAAHVLTLSPPLNMSPRWLGAHPSYTVSKYAMTLLTLGFAEEFRGSGIAANCLWPQTTIATAAVQNLLGGESATAASRSPQIMADAAIEILASAPADLTGRTLIDEEVLREAGVTDFRRYGGGECPETDLFIDTVG
ncbi:SDR family oxidoreductase [Nocardia sp. NPDC052278]|uniref:SDR family oxidoreductase n=1 Tax=unclassified Nocardia TaxID=2637762 RepID=UPI0036B6342F